MELGTPRNCQPAILFSVEWEEGNVKHHLSLPESAWLGLLLDNSWGPDCHQSGLEMKTGKGKSIELEMKGGGAIPSTLE